MKRRSLLLALAALPLPAHAAWQDGKVARVGYLDSGTATGTLLFDAFRRGLQEHGWFEGRNLSLVVRAAEGKYDRLPQLAAELVKLRVDVVFASSTPAALAAKQATSSIPIVIGRVADPIASGLVQSLARPGGNVTGWTHQGLELREKYLDLLRSALPGIQAIGVLWNAGNTIHNQSLGQVAAFAQAAKVNLHPVAVSQAGELDAAFAELASARVQGLAVFQDGMFLTHGSKIIALAAKHRIPTLYGATELVRDGGLMGYGVNLPDMYRQGATYVDRILEGAKPAELPIQQPTKFELVVNLRTARALKLTLPASFLARADTVIA